MSTADLLQIYGAALEANSVLDRAYYENPSPTSTDRAAYHERLEQLSCLRERLYAALSASGKDMAAEPRAERKNRHDLNNQLTIILGYIDLLSTPSLDPDTLGGLEQIRTAGLKMREIIRS